MNFNYNQVLTLNKTIENLEIQKFNCLLCEANIHCLIDEFHLFQFQNSSILCKCQDYSINYN